MKYAVILAAGEGHRAGSSVPKQFRSLGGRPVLWWSMKRFCEADADTRIVLVMHPGFFDLWDVTEAEIPEAERIPHLLCCGGRTRTESVANALISVRDDMTERGVTAAETVKVAVHDAARPLIDADMLARGWDAASPGVCGVPVVSSVSSLRQLSVANDFRSESRPVDRSLYVEVQTPQTFMLPDLEKAYGEKPDGTFTDDASLAQACGIGVRLYEGLRTNLKITYPDDFAIAELLMGKSVERREKIEENLRP